MEDNEEEQIQLVTNAEEDDRWTDMWGAEVSATTMLSLLRKLDPADMMGESSLLSFLRIFKSLFKNRSRKFPEVTRYAYGLLELADFQSLGKELPDGAGRDDSLTESGESREGGGSRPGKRSRSDGGGAIAEAIAAQGKRETEMEGLKLILQFGSEADKAAAMEKLKQLTGLN